MQERGSQPPPSPPSDEPSSSSVTATAGARFSPRWLSSLWRATGPRLARQANTQHAAMLLRAFASLDLHPPPRWTAELLAAVGPHLRHASDEELTMMMLGLGKLRAAPQAAWMDRLLEVLLERAPGLSAG